MTELQEVAQAMHSKLFDGQIKNKEQARQYVSYRMPDESFEIRMGVSDALWAMCKQPPAAQ